MRVVAPFSHPEPPVVRLCAQVTVSPATLVEVALMPPVAQVVEVASSAEVCPQTAQDSGTTESGAAVADSPTWAERVEMQEEELCAMSTSSQDDCLLDQDPAPAPPVQPQLSGPRCKLGTLSWQHSLCFSSQTRSSWCLLYSVSSRQTCHLLNCLSGWNGCG